MNRTATSYRNNNNERFTNDETRRKMAENTDFGPRKTIIVLAIVVGCFAILWPKIFYPMISTPASSGLHHSPVNGHTCCDVIFESDVNTVDIMQEMCKNILRHHQVDPRVREALQSGKLTPQSASFCRDEVLARCAIDLSSFLAEKERLGKTYKQVLEEIRSFNSSLCLKVQFGVPLSQLGTPHLIRYHILMPHNPLQQERRTPPHAGGLHPALRERGRAIPSSHIVPKVDGRPEHVIVHKMRPPLGASGRLVPAPTGSSSMGIILPLYTLGIVVFFLYTVAKVMRKNDENTIYAEYQNPLAEREFRNRVFSPEALGTAIAGPPHYAKDRRSPSPRRPPPTIEQLNEQAAGDIEIDQLRQRLVDTEAAMERIVVQMGSSSRTVVHSPQQDTQLQDDWVSRSCCSPNDESSSTVKVMGMEMVACCEGGHKISRPTTPVVSQMHSQAERELTPPKPIFLEGALPAQCELLVTDSATQAEQSEDDTDSPVVLSGKMTLSLISHDQIQADTEKRSLGVAENRKRTKKPSVKIAAAENFETKDVEPEVEVARVDPEDEEEDEFDEDYDSDDEGENEEGNQENNETISAEDGVQRFEEEIASNSIDTTGKNEDQEEEEVRRDEENENHDNERIKNSNDEIEVVKTQITTKSRHTTDEEEEEE